MFSLDRNKWDRQRLILVSDILWNVFNVPFMMWTLRMVFHLLIWQRMSGKSLKKKRKCEQQFNSPLSRPPGVATSFISLQRKISVVRGHWWLFAFPEQGQSHFHYFHLKVTNAPLICPVTWIWVGGGQMLCVITNKCSNLGRRKKEEINVFNVQW